MTFIDDVANPDGLTTTETSVTIAAPQDDTTAPPVIGVRTDVLQGQGDLVGLPPGAPVPMTIELPTDYARAGEAASAADHILVEEQARFDARQGVAPITETIPEILTPVTLTNVLFVGNSTCPADIPLTVMGTTHSISFDPMCDVMMYMRPLFLAFGAFSCAIIFIGGLKS
jgi:hypothetical protein